MECSDQNRHFVYMHGVGQIVPELEKTLEGLVVGSKKKVTVPPSEGCGDLIPRLKTQIDRSNFPERFDIQEGEGKRHIIFEVLSVESDKVNVDGNHPLAGEILYYSVEVTGIREATQEELSHGHAHGGGGVHHH